MNARVIYILLLISMGCFASESSYQADLCKAANEDSHFCPNPDILFQGDWHSQAIAHEMLQDCLPPSSEISWEQMVYQGFFLLALKEFCIRFIDKPSERLTRRVAWHLAYMCHKRRTFKTMQPIRD